MKKIIFLSLILCCFAGCNKHTKGVNLIDSTQVNQEGLVRMPMDGFELIAIQDLPQQMPASLFPTLPKALRDSIMPEGSAPAGINVFLVANDQHQILFDAGMGADKGGVLISKLKALAVSPEQVDAIFLTHLHPDHIGGLVQNEDAVFPNAQIYMSVEEFDAWTNGPMKEHNEQVTNMLSYYADRINLLQDGDTALGFVVARVAPGHTPGHTLYELPGVLISGDLLHAMSLQMDYPEYSSKYDFDPAMAAAARKQYLEYAAEQHLVLAGMHFPDGVIQR